MANQRQTFGDRMAALANRRHELFAQALAKGETQERAYALAGYKPDRGAASRLSSNVNIQGRLAHLLDRAAIRVEVTAETIAGQLAEDRAVAKEMGQASAMVSATMGLAKLFGLITDKAVIDQTLRDVSDKPETPMETLAALKAVAAENGVTVQ